MSLIFLSCIPERKPEFYKDGKGYYTRVRCVKSHNEIKYGYHYGYHMGKFQNHYGSYNVTVCDSSVTDTIEIKKE